MKIENEVLYNIWKDRYSKNNESIDDNLHRVAKYVGQNEKEENDFYNIMDEGLFFPAGRTMSNAGIGKNLTLNNCFTLNFVEDSIDGIFEKIKIGAKTQQVGGGTGYEFSKIRPKGSPTSNDAIASGVVSFMDVFNAQTATILQGGRRGANMSVLSIYHPDIYDYIKAKSYEEGKLIHFNMSVMVDDDFMLAVKDNKEIEIHYPIYDNDGFMIKDKTQWKIKKTVEARILWDLLMHKAYDNGEPGIMFYNNMNKDNNTWYMENIVNTNPCSEYVSGTLFGINPITKKKINPEDYMGACNLGSTFISNFVIEPFTKNARIDFNKLKYSIHQSVRILDNIIDINKFPHQAFENYQKNLRTIGLGDTGLADTLAMLNIKYGSEESINFASDIENFISKEAYKASINLAKEKGEFPFLDREKFIQSGFMQKHIKIDSEWKQIAEDILTYGIRNARIRSIAPCGTLSLTYGNNCSSSLEPIFSLSYDRKVKIGGQDDSNIKVVKMQDYAYKEWLKIKDNENCIVKEDIFVTAMNLPVQAHLDVLKAIAFHIDMSCSKTINIPTDYPFEDIKKVYEYAWENGIKGCTIFRPNEIRQGILIVDKKEEPKQANKKMELPRGMVVQVDDSLIGKKRKIVSGCGNLHVEAFFSPDTGDMMEIFLSKGAYGGCNSLLNGLSRMTSVALRGGIPIEEVIEQLSSSITCPSYAVRKATKNDVSKGHCCPDAIGRAIQEMQTEIWEEIRSDDYEDEIIVKDTTKKNIKKKIETFTKEELDFKGKYGDIAYSKKYSKCPLCNSDIRHEGGCISCVDCGWSKCD